MSSKHNKKQKEPDSKIGICQYHLCKKKTKVYRCKYCSEYFCKEHLQPKLPGMPRFNSTKPEDRLFMEEWRKPGGHPCIPYSEIWRAEQERKEEEYRRALDKLLRSKPLRTTHEPEVISRERVIKRDIPLTEKLENYWYWNKRKIAKIIVILLLFVGMGWFFYNSLQSAQVPSRLFNLPFFDINHLNCSDGTLYNHCSKEKPYYCLNGTLVKKASICGCPAGYKINGDDCEKIWRCSDGTIYGECSQNRPFYCLNGTLVERASLCGCPPNEIPKGDICISKFEVRPKNISLKYVLRGETGFIQFTVYGGVNDYLRELPRSITYYEGEPEPTTKDFVMKYLNDEIQTKYLKPLAEKIKKITSNKDDQARITISLVQHIPYDLEGYRTANLEGRYPYEVVYDNKGVCGEKSQLLAFLLRELGFGVVLFNFEIENHMAVGIKCPTKYSYKNTGYCFIETTEPTIITDYQEEYVGVGKLSSTPEIIYISEGASFDTVAEEYEDAQEWIKINEISKSSGGYLDEYHYNRWLYLVNKYGIEIDEE